MTNPDEILAVSEDDDLIDIGLCFDDETLLGQAVPGDPALSVPPSSEADVTQWFNHAVAHLIAGTWSSALTAINRCLSGMESSDPLAARAYALRGYALLKLGRLDQAEASFAAASDLDDETIEVQSGLTLLMARLDQDDRALNHAKRACEIRPMNASCRFNLARLQDRSGDIDTAISTYHEVLTADTGHFAAWLNLGAALAARGHLEPSVEALNRAGMIQPASRRVQTNLGIALGKLKRWDASADALRQAIQLDPTRGRPYIVLSLVECCRGDDVAAIDVLNQAIDRGLEVAKAFHNLGLIHSRFGHRDQAIAAFLSALQARPGYAKVYQSLGLEYVAAGRPEEATAALQEAARLRPDLTNALTALAELAIKQGDRALARKHLNDVLAQNPLHEEANSALGLLHAEAGERVEALRCFRVLDDQNAHQAAVLLKRIYPE
jgi:tetratricopeptide (TPR) repeat protein